MTESVRRRVDAAMGLALRRALRVGVPLVAIGVGADAVHLALRFGREAVSAVALEAAAIGAALLLAYAAVRIVRRPELAIMAMLLVLFAVTLVNAQSLPVIAPLSDAYLAVILVGSALFLPWSPGWHRVWLGVALGLTVASFAGSQLGHGATSLAISQLMAVVIASLASVVGHAVAHGRARRLLEQRFELRRLTRLAQRQEREVATLNRELVRTARLDTVTGIGNRRALDEALLALAGHRLAAVLLDVDHFKAFNDRNGHLAGDAALARVGEILRAAVRRVDLVFRYGGEEFLILLPDSDHASAARVAERVRQAVGEDPVIGGGGLTVSAGVAVADRFSASSPTPLLRRADAALYQAKRTGRNRVVIDDPGARALSSLVS